MMRKLALLLFLALPLVADPRIDEGTKLHDQGKYDEALAKYRAVLADDPTNDLARYEIALTLHAQGKFAECRDTIEPISKKKSDWQIRALAVLGNCLDGADDPRGAVAAYKRGLKIAPDDAGLLYNAAITQIRLNNPDEARKLLKKELTIRPDHASGHWALAKVLEHQGFRGPAVLAYLRMLSYELNTARSREAAQNVLALVGAGVTTSEDGKNINIVVDPKSRTEEGDYSGWYFMMALAAGSRNLEENEGKSEFERSLSVLNLSMAMLTENKPRSDWSAKNNLPLFLDLHKEELLNTFLGAAMFSLDLPGEAEWRKANEAQIEKLAGFLARYRSR